MFVSNQPLGTPTAEVGDPPSGRSVHLLQ